MPGRWRPPDSETELGLGFYASDGPGIGGTLKERPEDFRVTEVSLYPRPDPEGRFVVLRILSRDWEQHELSQRIAAQLGLPGHALRWAGTKDRRAIAERLASYQGRLPERPLELPGVELVEAYRSRDGLVLGHHFGNSFEIRITRADPGASLAGLTALQQELRAFGGMPNFFGPQRFGEVRPVTHRVGGALVRGDLPGAVELYLTMEAGDRTGPGPEARRAYAGHHDPQRALREFPSAYRFERQLLDHLARGNPPERALRALPRELRILFVHAFQSLLFNRYLTERVRRGWSLTEPQPGDRILRVARDGTIPGHKPVAVAVDNLPEARDNVARGRAVVAGPLPGSGTVAIPGPASELLAEILEAEGVALAQFALPKVPELASEGTWRPLVVPLPPMAIRPAPPGNADATGTDWEFAFTLPRGSYATVLLREFRKSGTEPATTGADGDPPGPSAASVALRSARAF